MAAGTDVITVDGNEAAARPDHAVLLGSAQNPDVFFQAREAASPYHAAVPGIVQRTMDRFAEHT